MARTATENKTDEFATFSAALKKILSVPHSEVQARIQKQRKARKRAASRVAAAKS